MLHEVVQLEGRLAECLAADRALFRRRLKGLRRALKAAPSTTTASTSHPQSLRSALAAISRDIARSIQRRQQRLAALPALTFTDDLPVARERHTILRALEHSQVIVVSGDTGSGKTTVLPKIALAAGRGVDGAIALTQPRRIAARSVATWISRDLASPLGQAVGFKVRFDDRTNPNTLVRVVTDGVLLAEITHDPLLRRYDTVIIDEAHERSLNIDFLLGYLKLLLPKRPDLKLIVSSATLDVERFSSHFAGAPVVAVGGRMHPIELLYRPPESDEGEGELSLSDRAAQGVLECISYGPGDILVFLPGERDIQDCAEALTKHAALQGAEILPLFSRLTSAEQDRVFAAPACRRVILSTNIAETSVTVPGIRFAVDTGLARISRWSGKNRVLRLPVEPVSQASADQRKGRCGRVGPGVCIRLYSQQDFESREPFTPPELLRTNLASVILQMKSLGLGEVADFPFLDTPSPRLVTEGLETLTELGAVDKHAALTPLGRAMSRLPVDPRIARMILAAADLNCLTEALVVGAYLSIQDPRERPADKQSAADMAHLAFRDVESDFASCLKLWRAWKCESAERGSSALRRWSKANYLSHARMREWTELTDQLQRLVAERLGRAVPPLNEQSNLGALHRAILAGFPSQLAQRTDQGDYLLPSGGRFQLLPGSVLARRSGGWVVCAEIVDTGRRWGRMAARVQADWIETLAPHLVQRTRSEPHWVRATGQVAAWERLSYGQLTLIPRRRVPYGPVAPIEARNIFIQSALVEGDCALEEPFTRHNAALQARIEALEAKRREHGLLAEGEARFRFFDERVPAEVHSLPAFQRWRKHAERRTRELLFMQSHHLMQHEPDADTAHRFPDSLELASGAAPLHYQHEPGTEHDGVTLHVPLHALHSVDATRAEWLVPGLLPEKIEALLRTLPKRLRLRLFPLKEFAQGAAESLEFGQGVLTERLANHLTKLSGTLIQPQDFDLSQLPGHLRMHVRVLDDTGRALASGQDLRALRVQLAALARAQTHADLYEACGQEWSRKGLTSFDIAHLPEQIEGRIGDRRVVAYPALHDDVHSVSLALHAHPDAAERATRRGLRRLFFIAAEAALNHHLDYVPEVDHLAQHFQAATGGSLAELRTQLALAAADTAYVQGRALVRTAAEFETRLDQGNDALWDALRSAVEIAERIHTPAAQLKAELATAPAVWRDAVQDITARLHQLAGKHTLTSVEGQDLQEFPRYIRALQVRFRKLGGGGYARDRSNQAKVERWEAEVARAEAALAAEGSDTNLLEPFRRLLQEYHVSLFAQEVRTPVPMSAERLERAWKEQRVR